MKIFDTMKIVEFFLIFWRKWSELDPEFLTSWSRTKMDCTFSTGTVTHRGSPSIADNATYTVFQFLEYCTRSYNFIILKNYL
jgi:hypothetical protein